MDDENKHKKPEETSPQEPIEEQGRSGTGQERIRLDFDERNLRASYANGFRTTATEEEVVVDFGLNRIAPSSKQQGARKIVFQAHERIAMSYYSAKRLTIALSQIIRQYENEFGELELEVEKRRLNKTR
jgi:hypothetical protein